jgi:hypothetical protein
MALAMAGLEAARESSGIAAVATQAAAKRRRVSDELEIDWVKLDSYQTARV